MSCEFSHLDGSYVLGALSPGERREFEEHLAGCASCAQAVRELAGLPGLLSRVDPSVLTDPPEAEPPPDTLLPSLLGEVRRSQRRRTLAASGLAAAAAVLVTIGAAVTIGVNGNDGAPAAGPPPIVTTSAGSHPMTAVRNVGMTASLALQGVPWGTRLDLACTYAPEGTYLEPHSATYALVVHTSDGGTEQVATWRALPGRTMQLTGATSATPDQITSVEVRAADGDPVLRLGT